MDNKTLENIKDYIITQLSLSYQYCGVAEGDNIITINSDDKNGKDIKITIELVCDHLAVICNEDGTPSQGPHTGDEYTKCFHCGIALDGDAKEKWKARSDSAVITKALDGEV
jgi:hypothetical protein